MRSQTCPFCGGELKAEVFGGLCPRCVLQRTAADEAPLAEPQYANTDAAPALFETRKPNAEVRSCFGDYELLEQIGRGGMGVVYKARQRSLDRIVALKMLLFGPQASPEFVQRFRAEAVLAAGLQHPSIVAIHEVGVHEGQQFFAMDYVAGPSLAQIAGQQPLPGRRAARYLKTIAEAIHYAHGRGILHRDLKPSNVLIDTNDQPRVTDFGLAKHLTSSSDSGLQTSHFTLTGQVLGSPSYIPPEQALGKRGKVSRQSDVYALGAMLYHLVTGRPPFQGETITETLQQVLNTEPVAPRLLNPSLPRDLETVCLKCLEKEPSRRYASAQALADELGRFLENKPILARPVGLIGKTTRWCRRKPALAAALGAVALVAAVGMVGVLWQWRRAETQRDVAVRAQTRAELENYDADIGKAQLLVEQSQFDLAEKILAREEHARDRGWEWGWLQRLCNQELMRFEHPKPVWSVAFSPDQRYLATGCVDGKVCLWDLLKGQMVRSFQGHSDRVASVAFSPDGTRLLTASYDRTARLWDMASDTPVLELKNGDQVVQAVFSGDGKLIATAAKTGGARLWDARTGKLVRESTDHEQPVFTVAFSLDPESRRLAWAGGQSLLETDADISVTILDWLTGKRLTFKTAHRQTIFRLCFSPDGKLLATASPDGPVRLWNTDTGDEEVRPLQADFSRTWMMAATFSPDGRWLAVGGAGWEVARCQIFEVATGRLVRNLAGHNTMVQDVAFSRDGRWLATPGYEGTARVWSVDPVPEFLSLEGHDSAVWSVAFSVDGRKVASGSLDLTARVWDADTGAALETITVGFPVVSLALSPDSERLVTPGPDHAACIWTIRVNPDSRSSRREEVQTEVRNPKSEIPNSESLLKSAATNAQPLRLLGHTGSIMAVAWSPDGRWILTGAKDNSARLWDAATGSELRTLTGHTNSVLTVAFSPDGQRAVTGSEDKAARIWELSTGRLLQTLTGHTGSVQQAAFRPDGRRVATGSTDSTARLWNADTGELLFTMSGHRAGISSLTFSPDGARLVTTGAGVSIVDQGVDLAVLIWDTQTGQRLLKLEAHPHRTAAVAFSPDGRRLATGSVDNTIRIHEAFSWNPEDYAAPTGASFRKRVETYKRQFWREHMRSPSRVLPIGAEQVVPGRRWQNVYFSRLNLPAEGGTKTRPARPIPSRGPGAAANLIDLTACYNAALTETWQPVSSLLGLDNNLSALPAGVTNLDGVLFDVRGLIRLSRSAVNFAIFPQRVEIAVGQKFRRLHVLHGTAYRARDGTRIGGYRLHYRDGGSIDLPVFYGHDVQDYLWVSRGLATPDDGSRPVWSGSLDAGRPTGPLVQLFKSSYENPSPDLEVVRITFESAMTSSGPFLVALTVEP